MKTFEELMKGITEVTRIIAGGNSSRNLTWTAEIEELVPEALFRKFLLTSAIHLFRLAKRSGDPTTLAPSRLEFVGPFTGYKDGLKEAMAWEEEGAVPFNGATLLLESSDNQLKARILVTDSGEISFIWTKLPTITTRCGFAPCHVFENLIEAKFLGHANSPNQTSWAIENADSKLIKLFAPNIRSGEDEPTRCNYQPQLFVPGDLSVPDARRKATERVCALIEIFEQMSVDKIDASYG